MTTTRTYDQMYKPHRFALCSNRFAEDVYELGTEMTRPLFHVIAVAVTMFRYPYPGSSSEKASWSQKGWRVLNVLAVVTLVIPILSLLLAALGYPLRYFGAAFRPKEGVLQVRRDAPEKSDGGNGGVSMLCLNTAGMLPFISHYNHMREPLTRARENADFIAAADRDIVFLQETFHPPFTRAIWNRCKDQYKYALHSVTPQEIGIGTGLMIMSKYKIESVSYMNFSHSTGDDTWSKKGAVAATLDLGTGKKITVVNVHMQSESLFNKIDQGAITRAKQMAELAIFLKGIEGAVVVAGDFNFKNDAEFADETKHLFDLRFLRLDTGITRTWYMKDEKWGSGNWQQDVCPISNYDHFFYRGMIDGNGETRHFYPEGSALPTSPCSDHRPLLATMHY